MANTKRKRDKGPTSARPKTETAEVASPYTAGKTDYVERVSDTLTSMFNRRQISQLQFGAGDRYRSAWDMTCASPGGSMDFDRVRGSSGLPPSPALSYLVAAECVREARLKLYPKDYAMVHRVAVLGLTIEQAARQLFNSEWDGEWSTFVRNAGTKFRTGLDELADMWWPDARTKTDPKTGEEVRPMRRFMTDRADVTDAPAPERGKSGSVHATRDKIYRGVRR